MKNLKKQVIGFIAVLAMLINTIPMAVAEGDVAFSITNPFNYSEIYQTATAGSTYLAMNMTESNVDNHPFVEYSVYVEDAGDYNLEFKTSPIVGGAYTSPATVTVNNAVITPEQTQQIDINTRVYQSAVALNSGENKIRFAITGYRPNTGNTGLFHVYYLKGSKINYDLLKYEAEETGSFVRNGGFANATGFIHNQTTDGSAIEAGNVWCSKTFSAPAGKYLLTWRSTLIAGTQYVSKVELTVNEQVVTAATATADGDPWYIQTAEIPLVEGSNTIKFTVTSKKNNGAGSNALFYLDYIQLERKDSAEYKDSKFEGEDATGSGSVIGGENGDGFSGGAWRRNTGTATTTFDTAAGDYELYLTLGASIDTTQRPNGKYLGRAAISIDGGADIALDGTNMTIEKGLTGSSTYCTNSARWKYNPVLTLTEGEHTLAVKYTGIGENGNNNEYIVYDCFELVPQDAEIDGANISIVSSKIACGNTAQANAFLYYTNKHICPDSVIKSTVYSSSNTAIASVDENGLITALNPGIANISVTFTDNEDQTYTASKQVFVYDESGIILVSSNYDETTHKATIKLTRVTDGTDTAVVVIGAFGKVGDKLTSFTSSPEIINSVNPEKGGVIKIEKTIEGDAIRGFVWNNLTEMKPATDSVVLK